MEITSPPAPSLRYQLFHRAASALIEAQRLRASHAIMVVRSFSQADAGYPDYVGFTSLFGITPSIGQLVHLGRRYNTELYAGWARGEPRFLEV